MSKKAAKPAKSSAKPTKEAKPVKKPVTLRLDADVVARFKDHAEGRGYQTEINRVLRLYITETRA